jgi:nucleoid DNA-binding protein/nucleoid-associated protein YgaU
MNNKLLLQDLVDQLAEAGNIKKKDAEEFLRAFFKVSEDALFQGKTVKVSGLGSFKLIVVDARKSVNVSTGEEIEIKEHYKLSFIPDNELKDLVNKPYAHLEPVELDAAVVSNPVSKDSNISSTKAKAPKKESASITESEEEAASNLDNILASLQQNTPNKPQKPKTSGWIWAIFFSVILLLGLWSFLSNEAQKREDSQKIMEMERADSLQAISMQKDSLSTEIPESINAFEKDSLAQDSILKSKIARLTAAKGNSLKEEPAKKVAAKDVPAKTSVSKGISATLVLKPGQRLTWISNEYYGHKAFWVYIYQANKDVIKNPNVIPVGATIRIPKADPSIIDAKNPALIAKAIALQAQILAP